jgi:hypothetical protein
VHARQRKLAAEARLLRREGHRTNDERLQPAREQGERLLRHPRSDPAGIEQAAVIVEKAEQKRAEKRP